MVGNLATEAKYINLSLHYLEQVIVALGEKTRTHIPYRNSMMTSVLKDSLGGNCKTTMIATLNTMKQNLDESISTCRFAQRVALIKNEALINEEGDPLMVIAALRKEIERLTAELALAQGGSEMTGPLDPADILRCKELVDEFVANQAADATLHLGDMRKIQQCFVFLKERVTGDPMPNTLAAAPDQQPVAVPLMLQAPSVEPDRGGSATPHGSVAHTPNPGEALEIERLTDLVGQRDNEISILVAKLKRERAKAQGGPVPSRSGQAAAPAHAASAMSMSSMSMAPSTGSVNPPTTEHVVSGLTAALASHAHVQQAQAPRAASRAAPGAKFEIPADRQEAFEHFKKNYPERHQVGRVCQRLLQTWRGSSSVDDTAAHMVSLCHVPRAT